MSLNEESSLATTVDTNVEEERRRFRCCCGLCHAKIGTYIVFSLETIGVGAQLVNVVINVQPSKSNGYYYATDSKPVFPVISLGVSSVLVVSLLIGLVTGRPCLLLPHLICQALLAFLFTLLFLGVIVGIVLLEAAESTTVFGPDAAADFVQLSLVGLVAGSIGFVQAWCFVVVFTCYRYFHEKQRALAELRRHSFGPTLVVLSRGEISCSDEDSSFQSSTPLVK